MPIQEFNALDSRYSGHKAWYKRKCLEFRAKSPSVAFFRPREGRKEPLL